MSRTTGACSVFPNLTPSQDLSYILGVLSGDGSCKPYYYRKNNTKGKGDNAGNYKKFQNKLKSGVIKK